MCVRDKRKCRWSRHGSAKRAHVHDIVLDDKSDLDSKLLSNKEANAGALRPRQRVKRACRGVFN